MFIKSGTSSFVTNHKGFFNVGTAVHVILVSATYTQICEEITKSMFGIPKPLKVSSLATIDSKVEIGRRIEIENVPTLRDVIDVLVA